MQRRLCVDDDLAAARELQLEQPARCAGCRCRSRLPAATDPAWSRSPTTPRSHASGTRLSDNTDAAFAPLAGTVSELGCEEAPRHGRYNPAMVSRASVATRRVRATRGMPFTLLRLLAVLALPGTFAACGQKGPSDAAQERRRLRRVSARAMTPLPGAPFLHRRGTDLWLEGARLADLAAAHGTPLYVYSRGAMRAALAPYQTRLSGRPAPDLLRDEGQLQPSGACRPSRRPGCGFDIVSGGELQRVLAIGGDPSRVVFSGVGKTIDEMRFALAVGVRCFNVESESELLALSKLAATAGTARAGQPARQPGRRRQDPSLHLHRACAATSSASPTSSAVPCTNRRARAARHRRRRHRLPHRLAGHRQRTVPRGTGAFARSGGGRRARRRAAVAHRSRRWPGHHLHRRSAARRRRADRRACWRASMPAATGIARS